jgi:hypothetical protein
VEEPRKEPALTISALIEGDLVRWNTDGTKFAIICGANLTVYGIVSTLACDLDA